MLAFLKVCFVLALIIFYSVSDPLPFRHFRTLWFFISLNVLPAICLETLEASPAKDNNCKGPYL